MQYPGSQADVTMNATQPPAGFPVLSEPLSGPEDHSLPLVLVCGRAEEAGWGGSQWGVKGQSRWEGRLLSYLQVLPP